MKVVGYSMLFASSVILNEAPAGEPVCWECPLAKRGGAVVTVADLQARISPLSEREKGILIGDGKQLEMMVDNMLLNRQLTLQLEGQLDESDPVLTAQLRQARENVLAVAQLNRIRNERIAGDFEELAREHYATTKSTLVKPREVKVRHLLVGLEGRSVAEAESIAKELSSQMASASDAIFAAKVNELSDDSGKSINGGIYNVSEHDSHYDSAFSSAALAMDKPGSMSQPVRTQFGFHLIRLLEVTPAGQMSFEEAKPQLIEKVRTDIRRRVVSEYRNELSQKGDLEIFPENLRYVVVED